MMRKIAEVARQQWRTVLFTLVFFVLVGSVYLFRLGSLVPGNSIFEQPIYLGIIDKQAIIEDISFAPTKISQAVMVNIDDPNATLLRLVSVLIMFIAIFAFYKVLERWHSHRTAFISTILFATSSFMLHHGRLANHEVLYLAVIPILLLCGNWLRSKKHVSKMPLAALLLSILLYIPGVWLLYVALSIAFRKRIMIAWKFVSKKTKIATASIVLVALAPLIFALSLYPKQILSWLGFNRLDVFSIDTIIHQLAEIPLQLFVRGPEQPQLWLVGTPILDVFTVVMLVLGTYAYWKGPHTLRARVFLGLSGITIFLFILGGPVSLALLLPILYFVAANGIAAMLVSWYTVFPRNPVARSVGIGLLIIATIVTCSFHMKRYFIAWPNASETIQALSETTQQSDTIDR